MVRASLALVVLAGGCAAHSPPVRSLGYGAPGWLRQGELEIAGGFAAALAGLVTGGRDNTLGFAWDLGVSVHFDVLGKRGANTARRGLQLRI